MELVVSQDPALTCPSPVDIREALRARLPGAVIEDHASGSRVASLQLAPHGTDSFDVVWQLEGVTLRREVPMQATSCATSAVTVALLIDTWLHTSPEPEPEPEPEPAIEAVHLERAQPSGLRLRVGLAGGAAFESAPGLAPAVSRMATASVELETGTRWGGGVRAVVAEFVNGFRPVTAFGSVALFRPGAMRVTALAGISLDFESEGTSHVHVGDALWAGARWDWQAWSRYSVFAELSASSILAQTSELSREWAELAIGVACRL
ncbi:MAG TPA: hypothetical protein VGL61_20250 [Kofleriaceae bacterium]